MSNDDDFAGFLAFANALGKRDGVCLVPEADAEDTRNGATWVPGEVTELRRAGKTVKFVQGRPKAQWYWQLPDGRKITHD